jgi:hypothetical protein
MWSGNHKFYIQYSRLLRLQSFRITLYIAGYIVHTINRHLQCKSCKNLPCLDRNLETDNNFTNQEVYQYLQHLDLLPIYFAMVMCWAPDCKHYNVCTGPTCTVSYGT